MHISYKLCSLGILLYAMTASGAMAQSNGIQMLPPLDPATGDAAKCVESGGAPNRVLTWDGHTSLKCSNGLKIDNSGSVYATSNLTAGANGALATGNGSAVQCGNGKGAGAIRYNTENSTFEGCNGRIWATLAGTSGWVSMPPGGSPIYGGTSIVYPAGDLGEPEKICQNAGYSHFTGACRTGGGGPLKTGGDLGDGSWGGGTRIEGSLMANTTLGGWALSCWGGYVAYSAANLQIMCSK